MQSLVRSLGAGLALSAALLLPAAANAALITFTASSTQTAITGSVSLDTLSRTFSHVDLRFLGSFTANNINAVPFDFALDGIEPGSFNVQLPFGAFAVPYLGDVVAVTSSGPTPASTVVVRSTTLEPLISVPDSALPAGLDFTAAMLTFIGTNQCPNWSHTFLGTDGLPMTSQGYNTGTLFQVSQAGSPPDAAGGPAGTVPEPSSLALVALALLAAAARCGRGRDADAGRGAAGGSGRTGAWRRVATRARPCRPSAGHALQVLKTAAHLGARCAATGSVDLGNRCLAA